MRSIRKALFEGAGNAAAEELEREAAGVDAPLVLV